MPKGARLAPAESLLEKRFDGFDLTHVEPLYWPVWQHEFRYAVYDTVALDPIEEGLLLLVSAGIRSPEEAAALLGCSVHLVRDEAARLAAVEGKYACLGFAEDILTPRKGAAAALADHERRVPAVKTQTFLRDGFFGTWLSYGENSFRVKDIPDGQASPYRWLDARVEAEPNDSSAAEAVQKALREIAEPEVKAAELVKSGSLCWVELTLACYQPISGAQGRFLIVNPERADAPMPEMSAAFEHDLLRGTPKLYFPDGPVRAGAPFWQGLTARLGANKKVQELKAGRAVATRAAQKQQSGAAEGEREKLLAAEAHIRKLEAEIAGIPRTEHVDTEGHPALLREALRHARHTLILICPWIRTRVLTPYLADLSAALRRGVQVYIGYGMPKSAYHEEKTDPEALQQLKALISQGHLVIEHLGTHEKVIIQDDELFLVTSFNFFSYTGGDGRRESGLLQRGGAEAQHDKFLAAFAARAMRG